LPPAIGSFPADIEEWSLGRNWVKILPLLSISSENGVSVKEMIRSTLVRHRQGVFRFGSGSCLIARPGFSVLRQHYARFLIVGCLVIRRAKRLPPKSVFPIRRDNFRSDLILRIACDGRGRSAHELREQVCRPSSSPIMR